MSERVLYMDGLGDDQVPGPFIPAPSLTPVVAGEYRYGGVHHLQRPRWTPTKCRIVPCVDQDHALWDPFCERHGVARKARIRRLAERVQVPDQPVTGLANATRGTIFFAPYYLGTSADDDEGFAGDFYAREADCALEVCRAGARTAMTIKRWTFWPNIVLCMILFSLCVGALSCWAHNVKIRRELWAEKARLAEVAQQATYNPCGPHALGFRDDVLVHDPPFPDSWSVRVECPEKPPEWDPFPCGGESGPCRGPNVICAGTGPAGCGP